MKSIVALVALLAPSGVQARADSGLCGALEALVREARRTGEAQRPFVAQAEAFTFACGHRRGSEAQSAFCVAAQEAVGLEFVHGFPWAVYDCLRARGISPAIRTTGHYTGLADRGRMIRLSARWPGAVRIVISYTSFPDDVDVDDRFAGYRGRYDVVVANTE